MLPNVFCKTSPLRPVRNTPIVMTPQSHALADFRSQVTKLLQERDLEWESSRKLVGAGRLPETLQRLIEEVRRVDLPPSIREAILTALHFGHVERIQDLPGPRLKELTGLPPTKAVRALCVWFDLAGSSEYSAARSSLPMTVLESALQNATSPFDVLLAAESPSLLDLGAGDLSFASELADQYAAPVRAQGRMLALHCVDRLHAQSRLGGPLHPERTTLDRLRSRSDLSFQFFSGQDMFALERLDRSGKLLPCYTLVTCSAPATPTFAYEPTRLDQDVIARELQRTKGLYHLTDYEGEAALEVRHGERSLLFPPWKFDIRGPLALLDLISRRGQVCVLGAVDDQVFWELLSQVLEGPHYRPANRPFTHDAIESVFADVYQRLSRLAVGASMSVADCAPLRRHIPRVLPVHASQSSHYTFQSIQVRRGALFSGVPASSTARKFRDMAEEVPPWMLTLVPAR